MGKLKNKNVFKKMSLLVAVMIIFSCCNGIISYAAEGSAASSDNKTEIAKLDDLPESIRNTEWFKSGVESGIYNDKNAAEVSLSYLGETIDDIIIMSESVKGFKLQKFLSQTGYDDYTIEDLKDFQQKGYKTFVDVKNGENNKIKDESEDQKTDTSEQQDITKKSAYEKPRTDLIPKNITDPFDSGFDGVDEEIRKSKWFKAALEKGLYQDLAAPNADVKIKQNIGKVYLGEDIDTIIAISENVKGFNAEVFFDDSQFKGYTIQRVRDIQAQGFWHLAQEERKTDVKSNLTKSLLRADSTPVLRGSGGLKVGDTARGTMYVGTHASFNRNSSYNGNPARPAMVDHAKANLIDGRGIDAPGKVGTFLTLFNTSFSGFNGDFEILNGKKTSAYSTDTSNYMRCSNRGKASPEGQTSAVTATVIRIDGDVVTFKIEGSNFGGLQTVGGFITSVKEERHWVQIFGMKRNEQYTDKKGTSLDGARYKIYEKKADGKPGRELTELYVDGKPYLETQGILFNNETGVEHGFFRSARWEFDDDATYHMLMNGVCAIEIKSPDGHINFFGPSPDINTQYKYMPVNMDGQTWWGIWDDSIDLTEDDPGDIAAEFGWPQSNAAQLMMNPRWTKLNLTKKSANPNCTSTNPNYSLAGAVYGVYKDPACTDPAIDYSTYPYDKLAKLTTDASGNTNTVTLLYGDNVTYYVKELSAPKGFAIDTRKHEVKGFVWKETKNIVMTDLADYNPVEIQIKKRDGDTNKNTPQGNARLAGAEYTFKFFELDPVSGKVDGNSSLQSRWNQTPKYTWKATTNANGEAAISTDQLPKFTDTKGNQNLGLPIGIMYIKETKAPTGYLIDEKIYQVPIPDAPNADGSNVISTYNVPISPETPKRSGVKIKKVDWEHTTQQGDATLAGAQYQIINRSSEPAEVHNGNTRTMVNPGGVCITLTTDADGNAATPKELLPYGSYELKEIKPSTGYLLDKNVYRFDVVDDGLIVGKFTTQQANNGTIEVGKNTERLPEIPIRGGIKIKKVDLDDMKNHAQGDATLQGAEYQIINTSAKEVEVKINGTLKEVAPGAVCMTIVTDAEGFASTPKDLLPYGSYEIKESKPSKGYLIDKNTYKFAIRENGSVITAFDVKTSPDGTIEIGKETDGLAEPAIRSGKIKIQKVDYDDKTADAQGDATLQGATYEIINKSKNYVYVKNNKTLTKVAPNEVCWTFITDAKGYAETPDGVLSYGTYELRETKPSKGYLLDNNVYGFTIREDGKIIDTYNTKLSPEGTLEVGKDTKKFPEQVIRGGIKLLKVDFETMDNKPQGSATLKDAEYEIINKSENSIYVKTNGEIKKVAVGEVCMTVVTDINGYAETPKDALPYGTYELRETKPSKGYLLDKNTYGFSIRENGVVLTSFGVNKSPDKTFEVGSKTSKLPEKPIRGDLELVKIDEQSQRLANVPFKINSKTTGENHVIVTDSNGYASTASDWNPHTRNTNRGETAEDGIWFGTSKPDDTVGALIYDTYTIEELECESNKGFNLIKFDVVVERDSKLINLGTITNLKPQIKTIAKAEDGSHYAKPLDKVKITDSVFYKNFPVGEEIEIFGTVMDKATGNPLTDKGGNNITASTKFTVKEPNGEIKVEFLFDASALAGKEIVIFEKAILVKTNTEIASHEDINDQGQTIKFSSPPETTEKKTTEPIPNDSVKTGDDSKFLKTLIALVGSAIILSLIGIYYLSNGDENED